MNTNTWITIIAIAILLFAGIYVLRNGDGVPDIEENPTFVEVIDGEEVVLDYPLVESFSNASSNGSLTQNAKGNGSAAVNASLASNVITAVTKPFVLGFYYFENIQKKGLENCIGREVSEYSEPFEFPEYNEDNFRLTEIQIKNRSAYLYVDADESPDGLCALVSQYENISNSILDAIHVVVN